MSGKPRLALVSYKGTGSPSPRGDRVRALLERLRSDWDLELLTGPDSDRGPGTDGLGAAPDAPARNWARIEGGGRTIVRELHRSALIDKQELWSKVRFARWRPEADLGLLIGAPFSPVAQASRQLARRNIPYVVDMGDPWALTAEEFTAASPPRALGLARARRLEARTWNSARGAIVTSERQANALRRHFPHLRVLVRPNGYTPIRTENWGPPRSARQRREDRCLRLAHFGSIYGVRVDARAALERLAQSRIWQAVSFDQYGYVWDLNTPSSFLPEGVEFRQFSRRPWDEIVERGHQYDLAVVLGNRSGLGPSSKVFQYFTLPIRRLALVTDVDSDETAAYLRDKPGWLVSSIDDPDIAEKVAEHVSRSWSAEELAPPESESWPHVTEEISEFLHSCLEISS